MVLLVRRSGDSAGFPCRRRMSKLRDAYRKSGSMTAVFLLVLLAFLLADQRSCAFTAAAARSWIRRRAIASSPLSIIATEAENSAVASSRPPPNDDERVTRTSEGEQHCDDVAFAGPTYLHPDPRPLPEKLKDAVQSGKHPGESQKELGRGIYLSSDWRRAWYTYESPPDSPDLIDVDAGKARYEITDIEGELPTDLVGDLYRNGPGNFGFNGERVRHVLDGDGLIVHLRFDPPSPNERHRSITFKSRFVETREFLEEREANEFLYRGTFGTSRRGLPVIFGEPPRKGVNADPSTAPILCRAIGNAFRTNLKNPANTHIVSFGGKLLALYEAGLPYALDPDTLETLGEDTMGGVLPKQKLAVKLDPNGGVEIPSQFLPSFLGGAAHTAHPKFCPRTKHLVGWHWSQLVPSGSLEITLTEWSDDGFQSVASTAHILPNVALAPHDMALTENCIVLLVNALEMDRLPFLAGISGPAASLKMDGRSNVRAIVLPRPTASQQFEPYSIEVPPCFCIHFSHGYEDTHCGNLISYFSGWPPSDSKDFLGAWGGFCPNFDKIPPTFLWRLELDLARRKCVSLRVAPGASNVCVEHCVVHPHFARKRAQNVYAVSANVVGDSTAPCGYVRLRVEDGDSMELALDEANTTADSYWFGSRIFAEEPMVVPKHCGDSDVENDAYLLGMIFDAVRQKSALAVFDLQQPLREGPVCKLWLKSHIPHGLHGCFSPNGGGSVSTFC